MTLDDIFTLMHVIGLALLFALGILGGQQR